MLCTDRAGELTLLLDGVHTTAMTLGGHGPAQRAAQLAERIVYTAPERIVYTATTA